MSPVQTTVSNSLHGVKVCVTPVHSLGDDIYCDSCRNTESALHELNTVTSVHECSLQLYLLRGNAHVCEEHVAANTQQQNPSGALWLENKKWA